MDGYSVSYKFSHSVHLLYFLHPTTLNTCTQAHRAHKRKHTSMLATPSSSNIKNSVVLLFPDSFWRAQHTITFFYTRPGFLFQLVFHASLLSPYTTHFLELADVTLCQQLLSLFHFMFVASCPLRCLYYLFNRILDKSIDEQQYTMIFFFKKDFK